MRARVGSFVGRTAIIPHSLPPNCDLGASSHSVLFFSGVSADLSHLEKCRCEIS